MYFTALAARDSSEVSRRGFFGREAATLQEMPGQRIVEAGAQITEKSVPRPMLRGVVEEEWFQTAARRWKAATAGLSSISAKTAHPDFQAIIRMGLPALRLILRDLEKQTAHWFPALKVISGLDPVPPEHRGNVLEMRRAWLEWGRREGLIDES